MKKIKPIHWTLPLLILVGGYLRFYNLNWDQSHFFHPDERNIALAVSRIHFFNQLNPHFFAYGSLPIYLYRITGEVLVLFTQNPAWISQWTHINLIGRGSSALFSTMTIPLVFLLGKKAGNDKTGLLSAFLVAFTPSFIQTAHFGVTESLLTFWLILLSLFSLAIMEKPSTRNYLKMGTVLGLAAATKISSLSFLIIPFVAHFLIHFKYLKRHLQFLLALLAAFLVFSLLSPYVYLDQQKFLESMNYETGVASGRLKVVYTLQFEKTRPYLFQIKNFLWQMGPVALLGILGTIALLIFALKAKDRKILVLLSFPIIYFLYVGSWYTKFIRYMVPVLPFLAISAAWVLLAFSKRWKMMGKTVMGLACIFTLLWSLAFFSIYTRESTRITASRWIYQNLPRGATILQEHWDDGLPVSVNGHHPSAYQTEPLTIYEPDNEAKTQYYAEKLAGADYLVISSRRLYGTLISLPEKYPLTSRYYHLLFSGKLGYTKMAQFTSYPLLLGIEINDDKSEETFQVYDHPKVLIFKNQKRLSQNYLASVLKND